MKYLVLVLALHLSTASAVPLEGHKILIAGPSQAAADVGKAISAAGGNTIDVAVAVGLALSVTSPYVASLGGGGFALVRMNGPVEALDFRETAPAAMNKTYFKDLAKDASITGGRAVGVPGYVAGLWALHRKYGKLAWSKIVAPAVRLAREGITISGEWSRITQEERSRFDAGAKAHFLKSGESVHRPGEVLKQPRLAEALSLISRRGERAFYEGPLAQDIVASVQANQGPMSLADLKNYKVRWLKPMTTDFEGHRIYLMPPPSSGGVVITTALKLIEMQNLKSKPFLSVDELHLLGEIDARAFRGRALLGDPDFHKNPTDRVTSPAYLKELNASIRLSRATAMKPLNAQDFKESAQTTHFSVLDSSGNGIALTVTLNGLYGSGVATKNFGIALNNEIDDFTTKPDQPNMFGLIQGEGNAVEPGKRPLSSMSPTLVEKDGKIVMSLGSPGGPRIISAVLQVLYRALVTGLDMDQAIQAPRVHHQFQPNKLFVDNLKFSPDVIRLLKDRGHDIVETPIAKVYGVRINDDGTLEAAYDSRGEGGAAGF